MDSKIIVPMKISPLPKPIPPQDPIPRSLGTPHLIVDTPTSIHTLSVNLLLIEFALPTHVHFIYSSKMGSGHKINSSNHEIIHACTPNLKHIISWN